VKLVQWVQSYTQKYGLENINHLTATFGNMSTPDDPFMSGKVAIIIDGVWRYNFIQQFAPGLNYGVANIPEAQPGVDDFTIAEADMLVIPRGAKHVKEAWEFLKYISTPNLNAQSIDELSGVERLCFVQKKPSPLVQWSPYFTANHPNPNVAVFRALADSTHVVTAPKMGIWDEYLRTIILAFDKVRLNISSPEDALKECQDRMAKSWQWHQQTLALRNNDGTAKTP
jgi:multiple sugar transport system substrate-binding protein